MRPERLTAFSDGVLAIIITIMVLELRPPAGDQLADLAAIAPTFLSYVLSFLYVGIYWNNHHHLLQMADEVDGRILWANTHLLFWMSLIPVATAWLGQHPGAVAPNVVYGLSLLAPAVAYYLLQQALIRRQGRDGPLARALGRDLKGKASPLLYLTGMAVSVLSTTAAQVVYVAVALMWLVPDRRIERHLDTPSA